MSCCSQFRIITRAASCLKGSIVDNPGVDDAASQESAGAKQPVELESLSACLWDAPAMPLRVASKTLLTAAVESRTLDEVCEVIWQGEEGGMPDRQDSCRQGRNWCRHKSPHVAGLPHLQGCSHTALVATSQ